MYPLITTLFFVKGSNAELAGGFRTLLSQSREGLLIKVYINNKYKHVELVIKLYENIKIITIGFIIMLIKSNKRSKINKYTFYYIVSLNLFCLYLTLIYSHIS